MLDLMQTDVERVGDMLEYKAGRIRSDKDVDVFNSLGAWQSLLDSVTEGCQGKPTKLDARKLCILASPRVFCLNMKFIVEAAYRADHSR